MLQIVKHLLDRRNSRSQANDELRLAVVGTPRSGNTWFRHVLAAAYGLNENGQAIAVHNPLDANWEGHRYIVQVHIPCEPKWIEHFEKHRVKILVPIRHPFDVLISILHYVSQGNETHRWLDTYGGDEGTILGLHPGHPQFLNYVRSLRAKALLDVSSNWSQVPGAIPFHYEDLVAQPVKTLKRVAKVLAVSPKISWKEALSANTIERLRVKDGATHHWQGKPGLWKILLTQKVAEAFAETHRSLLEKQNYEGGESASSLLTEEEAYKNYQSLG